MNIVTPSEIKIGDIVKITVLDDESITYSGKVLGISTYMVAKSMGSDLAARHEQVRSKLVGLGIMSLADIVNQKFLIIDTVEPLPLVVAFEWIKDNAVELIELGATYTIKLINCSKDKAEEAVRILRANNVSCKLNVIH